MSVQDTSWHFLHYLPLSHDLNVVKLDQNESKIIATSRAFKTILRKMALLEIVNFYILYIVTHRMGAKLFRIA